jgi:hexokinase
MYLGEITRHLLVALVDAAPRGLIFGGKATTVVNTMWGLDTSVMSAVEDAWNEGGEVGSVPPFGEFDEGRLEGLVKEKLEPEVTLRDAAVSLPSFSLGSTEFQPADRAMGMWSSCQACRFVERDGCSRCIGTNRAGELTRELRIESRYAGEDQCRGGWQVCAFTRRAPPRCLIILAG